MRVTRTRTIGWNRSGQALVELAVFGTIALAALGFLIRIGMQMNYDQEIRMAAFRKGLAAAAADNGTDEDSLGTLYHYIANRQMPNPTDGFMTMPRSRTEASGFVEWGDRLTYAYDINSGDAGRKTQTKYVVRSDDTERTFRGSDFAQDIPTIPGVVVNPAFTSITRDSTTTNTSGGSITQGGASTSLTSGTHTTSTTVINTKAPGGDTVASNLASGSNVTW